LAFRSVVGAKDLKPSFPVFVPLFAAIVAVVLFTALLASVFLAPLPSIFGIQLQINRASFRIVIFLDVPIPMACANDESLVLVRGGIDPQIKASHLKLQDSVVDEGADASGYIHAAPRDTPLGPNKLTTLRPS